MGFEKSIQRTLPGTPGLCSLHLRLPNALSLSEGKESEEGNVTGKRHLRHMPPNFDQNEGKLSKINSFVRQFVYNVSVYR